MLTRHKFLNLKHKLLYLAEIQRLKIYPILTLIVFELCFFVLKIYKNELFTSLEKQSLHFNILSTNAILAGFLFTSLSILITVSNKRIVRLLNKGGYLRIIHSSIIYGMFSHIFSILFSFISMINFYSKIQPVLVNLEFLLLLIGVTFFLMAILKIAQVVEKIRKDDLNEDNNSKIDTSDIQVVND